MEVRVRFGFKTTAKGICTPDVTIDATLIENDTIELVGTKLNEAVTEFKKQVTLLGYKNLEVAE